MNKDRKQLNKLVTSTLKKHNVTYVRVYSDKVKRPSRFNIDGARTKIYCVHTETFKPIKNIDNLVQDVNQELKQYNVGVSIQNNHGINSLLVYSI